MKKALFIIAVFICGICASGKAQIKLMKDRSGIVLGYEDASGDLYNNSSTRMVDMQDSLTVIVPTGDTLASYSQSTGEFSYSTGELIFKINNQLQILNASNQVIGWIDEQNNLYGADQVLKVSAPGVSPFKLAYYFFFVNR